VRIIAGKYKGRRLKAPTWEGLRPTSDKLRETLFNILAPRIEGARVLDGYAGTGAVGIEALSRGAATATFVESDRRAAADIERNLEACGMTERATVLRSDWRAALRLLGRAGAVIDIAFFDPPYAWKDTHRCLEELGRRGLLPAGGWAVIEHRKNVGPRDLEGWDLLRELQVGDSCFSIFLRAPQT
jgi:16S rRNA (guanine(966)-N(2))-methyltransferase RsmD